MRIITFDIETTNTFDEVASPEPADLDLAVVCVHDSETDETMHYYKEDLHKLWPILENADALVGYNSEHFDTPLLNKYYEGDLTQIKSIDLMNEIRKSYGRRIKLDHVVSATLGEAKSAHGLQAIIWWRNNEKEKVVEYCKQDVNVTKKLFDFMRENKFVYIPKNGTKEKVKIDTSGWEKIEEGNGAAPTLGLGF